MQVDGHWNRLRVWRNQLDIFCCKPCDWRAGQGGPSHQCDGGRTEHTDQHPDKEARDTRSEGEIPHQASNRYGRRGNCSPRMHYFQEPNFQFQFFLKFYGNNRYLNPQFTWMTGWQFLSVWSRFRIRCLCHARSCSETERLLHPQWNKNLDHKRWTCRGFLSHGQRKPNSSKPHFYWFKKQEVMVCFLSMLPIPFVVTTQTHVDLHIPVIILIK